MRIDPFVALRRLAVGASLFIGSVIAAPAAVAQQDAFEVRRDIGVMVPMRDGVELAADIIRPEGDGRHPVIISRTPYGRAEMQGLATALAPRGYAFVLQDCRGRFDSEGSWEPFRFEAADGHDTIEWAAAQPWSNGKVAMIGGSYAAGTQWLAAKGGSEHLVGIVPFVSPGDIHDAIWVDGAFSQSLAQMWAVLMAPKAFTPEHMMAFQNAPWAEVFAHLPVVEGPGVVESDPGFYRRWIAHPTVDEYWEPMQWQATPPDVAALHITGWYDVFQDDTIENFALMQESAEAAQRLVVGPWTHSGPTRVVGEVDFGEAAAENFVTTEAVPFLAASFSDDGPSWEKPVRVFTMGENAWRSYDAWPVPEAEAVSFFLDSDRGANSSDGDGRLTREPADGAGFDGFIYDPLDPVPTRGGGVCCWPDIVPWGAFDQREIELRDDVLVYSTPPLEQDLRVTGPIEAVLYVSSSAPDTDFTAKLVDVGPDGFAMNLTDGIVRVSRRSGGAEPDFMEPGEVVEVRIDLGNTSNLFRAGHQIRLEVSSSNFPRFSRHTNTREQPETVETPRAAKQTVHHGGDRRSRLILPVLPAP